ncbi:MAG: hypothetical protein C5B51_14815 [Terriglobia bacterium]|nr:MAG: hypothetical protein C5B51_14815 [Terriglobia bacterium]
MQSMLPRCFARRPKSPKSNRRVVNPMTARTEKAEYLASYAAQLPVLHPAGQRRLRCAHVHVSGTGRIGGSVALAMAASGIGHVSANDPQDMEAENLGAFALARRDDLGKPKVDVLSRLLSGRPHFEFVPLVLPAESAASEECLGKSDLILSCANTLEARLAAERIAVLCRKPILQVAAFDGRSRLGGLITVRLPQNGWTACFGCLANKSVIERGEGLLSTVTWSLAGIASTMAVQILTGQHSSFIRKHNLFFIDLETYGIEALALQRRSDCTVCGAARRGRRKGGQ